MSEVVRKEDQHWPTLFQAGFLNQVATISLIATANLQTKVYTTALFEAAKDKPECLICVKTHPHDVPLSVYQQAARAVNAQNVRYFDDQFEKLLAACDVLVSGSSTTVLEAILQGHSTICVNFSGEPDWFPYVADGGSLPGRTPDQVSKSLERILSGAAHEQLQQNRQAFLAHHAGPTATGQAAETLAGKVLELAHTKGIGKEAGKQAPLSSESTPTNDVFRQFSCANREAA